MPYDTIGSPGSSSPGSSSAARVVLLTNLRALGEELPRRHWRVAVQELADRIAAGTPPLAALDGLQTRLPPALRVIFTEGLGRSPADRLLSAYLDQSRRTADLRRGFMLACIYPVMLLLLATIVIVMTSIFLVPIFDGIVHDFGLSVPALTRYLMKVARQIHDSGRYYLVGIVTTLCGIGGLLWLIGGRPLIQALFRTIPGFGNSLRQSSLASAAEMLALWIEQGLTLPESLRFTAEANDDARLSAGLRTLAAAVDNGHVSWNGVPGLPQELAAALQGGTKPELIAERLRSLAVIIAARSQVTLHFTRWMLEPVVLVLVALGFALLFLAYFMPLFKLLNDLA